MEQTHGFATDLERFLDLTGYSVAEVARATGVERSRLARIVSGDTPDPRASAYLAITAWADDVAKQKRLKKADRLNWAPRFEGEETADNAAR